MQKENFAFFFFLINFKTLGPYKKKCMTEKKCQEVQQSTASAIINLMNFSFLTFEKYYHHEVKHERRSSVEDVFRILECRRMSNMN